MTINKITAQEFQKIMESGQDITILDVRTDIECRALKLKGAFIHIPLHHLDAGQFIKDYGTRLNGKPFYILCRLGGRATKAAEILSPMIDVVVVDGGIESCCACNIPVERNDVVSLERQVRIAAGVLVVTGVMLGHFIDSGFFILSGAVGAGLVFAGITNWCGMALLLTRAPWNQNKGA